MGVGVQDMKGGSKVGRGLGWRLRRMEERGKRKKGW